MEDAHDAMVRIIEALVMARENIGEIFANRVDQRNVCQLCQTESVKHAISHVVIVPIPEDQESVILEECIMGAVGGEEIPEYACTTCDGYTPSVMTTVLESTADVLMIVIRRFAYDNNKIRTKVEYPMDLILPGGHYRLTGIANHFGPNKNRGHYTAQFYHDVDGRWVEANDHLVSPIRRPTLRSEDAYVLLYEKV